MKNSFDPTRHGTIRPLKASKFPRSSLWDGVDKLVQSMEASLRILWDIESVPNDLVQIIQHTFTFILVTRGTYTMLDRWLKWLICLLNINTFLRNPCTSRLRCQNLVFTKMGTWPRQPHAPTPHSHTSTEYFCV